MQENRKCLPGDVRRLMKSSRICLTQVPRFLSWLNCGGEKSFIRASVEPQRREESRSNPIQEISIIHPTSIQLIYSQTRSRLPFNAIFSHPSVTFNCNFLIFRKKTQKRFCRKNSVLPTLYIFNQIQMSLKIRNPRCKSILTNILFIFILN